MEEGKWYKCIKADCHLLDEGKYYKLVDTEPVAYPKPISDFDVGGRTVGFYHYRFDPTPHTRTTFPNMPNLIERVSKIDPAAAEWLEFGDHSGTGLNANADDIGHLFTWKDSPQSSSCWKKIYFELSNTERSALMQKEYEYEATGISDIMPGDISKFKPCDTEFGKAVKWYYDSKGDEITDTEIVSLLVKEQRFSWLNWLSENTPFVKRTEKKAFRFTPDTIRLAFSEDGLINSALEIKGTDGRWWTALTFCRDGNIYYALDCKNLPVQMDGDKIAIK